MEVGKKDVFSKHSKGLNIPTVVSISNTIFPLLSQALLCWPGYTSIVAEIVGGQCEKKIPEAAPMVGVDTILSNGYRWTEESSLVLQRDLEFTFELDFKGQLCNAAISHDYKMR